MNKPIKYQSIVPLFDIDLTLIKSSGHGGGKVFEYAIKKVFGLDVSIENMVTHGMVDMQIIRELLNVHGHSDIEIGPEQRSALIEAMEGFFIDYNKISMATFEVLPGARALLEMLYAQCYLIGVLTGNLEKIGRYKLQRSSLDKYISLGFFGNSVAKRKELSELAKVTVKQYFPVDVTPRLVIIGDTPLDISAAHEAGLPAIGVATGKYTTKELEMANAEAVAISLENANDFIELMESVVRLI